MTRIIPAALLALVIDPVVAVLVAAGVALYAPFVAFDFLTGRCTQE